MKILLVYLLSAFSLSVVAQTNLDIVKEKLEYQRIAWNDGDIEKFMEVYWNSPDLLFVGKKGITYGWENTLKRYKTTYSSKELMGYLTFEVLEYRELSNESLLLIGRWQVDRTDDTIGGHFSLVWKLIDDNWVIVADHTS